MVNMVKLKQKFIKGKFPYKYQCPKCKDIQLYDKEKYELMTTSLRIFSDNPVFFECYFCPGQLMKPKGYSGEPSYIMWIHK